MKEPNSQTQTMAQNALPLILCQLKSDEWCTWGVSGALNKCWLCGRRGRWESNSISQSHIQAQNPPLGLKFITFYCMELCVICVSHTACLGFIRANFWRKKHKKWLWFPENICIFQIVYNVSSTSAIAKLMTVSPKRCSHSEWCLPFYPPNLYSMTLWAVISVVHCPSRLCSRITWQMQLHRGSRCTDWTSRLAAVWWNGKRCSQWGGI